MIFQKMPIRFRIRIIRIENNWGINIFKNVLEDVFVNKWEYNCWAEAEAKTRRYIGMVDPTS